MPKPEPSRQDLDLRTLLRFWFPLSASWLLMSTETPIVTAAVARLPDAKNHLAAFGIAFSLVLMFESPIISMLTAGNALPRDRASLRLVRRFMLAISVVMTAMMALLSLTPLFELLVVRLMGTPAEIARLVRPVLWTMSTWPAAIAYRRFHQGIMIRHGLTRQMSFGTFLRMITTAGVSLLGLWWGRTPGATTAGIALGCAVIAEALYVHVASREAVRRVEAAEPLPGEEALTLRGLLAFYAPLTLTSMLMLSTTPILNYAMMRMPWPVESLAVWPVVNGQLFMVRSFGYSLQEAVVALLKGAAAMRLLRRFTVALVIGTSMLISLLAFTGLGEWWQRTISGLDQDLLHFAGPALRWVVLLPALAVVQSWLRGVIVVRKETRAIAWGTVVNLTALVAVLVLGIRTGWLPGAPLAAVALTFSQLVESVWLWRSARNVQRLTLGQGLSECEAS